VKTATNTPVCSLLEGVSISVLIMELLLILSINNNSITVANKWNLSGPKTISDGILEPLLMTFSVVVQMFF
jgi:hypothetical protein